MSNSTLASVLAETVSSERVRFIELDVIARQPSFRGGSVSEETAEVTGRAREQHRALGFGFWEFTLNECSTLNRRSDRRALLAAALRHNSSDAIRMLLDAKAFEVHLAAGDFCDLPARTLVNLCSPMLVEDGAGLERRQLPMLDFGLIADGDGAADIAVDVVEALGLKGAIFRSGRSFHFFGSSTVREDALPALLARAQLLSPLIDSRWISHQLIDGRCALRISTDVERHVQPSSYVTSVT